MLTQEQIVLRGNQAQRILGDRDLMGFLSEMQGDFLTTIAATSPDDTKAREQMYFMHRATVELTSMLQQYADAAAQITNADHTDVSQIESTD